MSFLAFLPLLITLILGVFTAIHLVNQKNKPLKHCLYDLIHAQKKMGRLINQVLRLNPKMSRQKSKYQQAQSRLKKALLSLSPPAIALASTAVAITLAQVTATRAEQGVLLAEIATLQRSEQLLQQKRFQTLGYVESLKVKRIPRALEATQPTDPFPLYKLTDDFEFKQESTIYWKFNALKALPLRILRSYFTSTHRHTDSLSNPIELSAQEHCTVTLLEKGGFVWKPQIVDL